MAAEHGAPETDLITYIFANKDGNPDKPVCLDSAACWNVSCSLPIGSCRRKQSVALSDQHFGKGSHSQAHRWLEGGRV